MRPIVRLALWVVVVSLLSVAPAALRAEDAWPSRPVRIVTAFGPGSASDIVARMIAQDLQQAFGQTFVVENRPGASGIVAASLVAEAPADGYTLFLTTNTAHSVNPYLFKSLPYDPIASFTPIARICNFPFVLAVEQGLPAQSVTDLLALARESSTPLNYAYGNSTGQVAGAAFSALTGIKANAIPYKSTPQAMTDLVGGRVAFMFVDFASSQPHVQGGRLRLLAVSTTQRSQLAPELPPVAQAAELPGFDLTAWVGLMGPAGLPPRITAQLSEHVNAMLARPEIVARLVAVGAEVSPAPADVFDTYLRAQLAAWKTKVEEAGIQPE